MTIFYPDQDTATNFVKLTGITSRNSLQSVITFFEIKLQQFAASFRRVQEQKSVVQMISPPLPPPPRAGRQKKNSTISGTEVNLVVGEARDSHPQLSASPLRTSGIMM